MMERCSYNLMILKRNVDGNVLVPGGYEGFSPGECTIAALLSQVNDSSLHSTFCYSEAIRLTGIETDDMGNVSLLRWSIQYFIKAVDQMQTRTIPF